MVDSSIIKIKEKGDKISNEMASQMTDIVNSYLKNDKLEPWD